jgi:hypothetical protein
MPFKKQEGLKNEEKEGDVVRGIGGLSSTDIRMIAACVSEGLVRLLGEEVDKLGRRLTWGGG